MHLAWSLLSFLNLRVNVLCHLESSRLSFKYCSVSFAQCFIWFPCSIQLLPSSLSFSLSFNSGIAFAFLFKVERHCLQIHVLKSLFLRQERSKRISILYTNSEIYLENTFSKDIMKICYFFKSLLGKLSGDDSFLTVLLTLVSR